MQFPRETIYSALFNLVKGLQTWNFVDRRLHEIAQLNEGMFPAMMMLQNGEIAEPTGRGIPIIWKPMVTIMIYVDTTNDPDKVPAQLLNPILDDVENAIQPDAKNPALSPQTLGGLVSQCRIKGEIRTDDGMFGARGFISIPVEMIVPA